MALETLNSDLAKVYNNEKEKMANTIKGCSIEVKGDSVNILIPMSNDPNNLKTLVFSKKEMRKLLEELYVS